MDNYFSLKEYVSNSDLTALQFAIGERPEILGDKQAIYNFGSLIDAMITEPELVVPEHNAIVNADGELISFDPAIYSKAMRMREDAMENSGLSLLLKNMSFQEIVKKKKFLIDSPTGLFSLPVRIKMDGCNRPIRTGWDLKTTAAKNQAAFRESLSFFEYDRQCAWYMDIAGLDRFWFTGIGKEPLRTGKHPIFMHAVERGDEFHQSGVKKYQRLAEIYHMCILSLNTDLIYSNAA